MYRVELTKQREGLGNQVEEMQGKDLKKKKKDTQQLCSSDAYGMEEGAMGEGEKMKGRRKLIR